MTPMDKLHELMDKLINDVDWSSNVFASPLVWLTLWTIQLGYAIGLETNV